MDTRKENSDQHLISGDDAERDVNTGKKPYVVRYSPRAGEWVLTYINEEKGMTHQRLGVGGTETPFSVAEAKAKSIYLKQFQKSASSLLSSMSLHSEIQSINESISKFCVNFNQFILQEKDKATHDNKVELLKQFVSTEEVTNLRQHSTAARGNEIGPDKLITMFRYQTNPITANAILPDKNNITFLVDNPYGRVGFKIPINQLSEINKLLETPTNTQEHITQLKKK